MSWSASNTEEKRDDGLLNTNKYRKKSRVTSSVRNFNQKEAYKIVRTGVPKQGSRS